MGSYIINIFLEMKFGLTLFAAAGLAYTAQAENSKQKVYTSWANNVGDMNMGMMLAMASGTTSSSSGCTDAATDTNDQILEMFDMANYTGEQFNVADTIDQG